MAFKSVKSAGPAIWLFALVIIAALPWGLPVNFRFFLPLLPLAAIHHWTMRRPEDCPEWLVFVAGLTVDVLTSAPLGYWALVYLAGYAAAQMMTAFGDDSWLEGAAQVCATVLAGTACAWLVVSLYELELAPARPLMVGASLVIVVALLFLGTSRSIAAMRSAQRINRFNRGG